MSNVDLALDGATVAARQDHGERLLKSGRQGGVTPAAGWLAAVWPAGLWSGTN